MSQNGKPHEPEAWLNYEAAIVHVGRSRATLRRAVSVGKIAKKALSVPGRRPEIQLSRADLDSAFGTPVHTPSMIATDHNRVNGSDQAAIIPAPNSNLPAALERIAEALANWPLATGHSPLELKDKLCWTLKDARTMTGLSRPALRELVGAHPDLCVRRGRRYWFRAGRLREVLG